MKHLKTYEKLLKFSDKKVVNHPLKSLTEKIIEVLNELRKLDTETHGYNTIRKQWRFGSKITKSFNDSGDINISYHGWESMTSFNLLTFRFWLSDDTITFQINHNNVEKFNNYSIELYNFIYLKFRNNIDTFYKKMRDREIYTFNISELNNIIEELDNFHDYLEIKLNTNKYNL